MAILKWKKCPCCGSEVDTVSVKEKDGNLCIDVKAKNRWISVSEQMPEYGRDVLVYTKSWEEHIQVAHIQYDGIMWELSDGEFYFSQSDVSHWMYLPEPPEVTQDE